ncbi:MGMT family protein [Rudaeicoccus suwonensis]|uniref:O(6)-alkylguanine repair protein YbaZ n=1 Tax=Rudaeicoccus suwonensis TaxID=657409 RepID=A0A561E1A2_9MICO|nr:MGMT family protein [Rudaeicoccus suwonensis]TWE09383.1 O(6)-alkylguanine repair protein YbaZ [Rudaeicoccus suwonensis]
MTVHELPDAAEAVLAQVDRVPPGCVVTYGDIAAVLGIGPRQVGAVLSEYGSLVCWWRVLRADGRPPQGHEDAAMAAYREEGTPLRGAYLDRVDLARARFALG